MSKEFFEILGGIAAILAVIGYASIRAYLNHLGAPDPGGFPTALYLFETYTFLTAATATLLVPCSVALSILTALWGITRFFRPTGGYLSLRLRRWSTRFVAIVFVLMPIFTIVLCLALLPGAEETEILLKPLASLSSHEPQTPLFVIPLLATLIYAFIGTSTRIAAYSRLALGSAISTAGRIGCIMSSMIMLWCSVVIFNVYVRGNRFPVVAILGAGETPIWCGLAILSTDTTLVLWRPNALQADSRGHFSLIKVSDTKEIQVGNRIPIDEILTQSVFRRCGPLN
jgi:hypothetical protein